MICLLTFPIHSKAGSTENFTIEEKSIELPIPNQKKDGKIEYLFKYEASGVMTYTFKSATNWKMETKKLNDRQAQIIVYIPYSSVKVITPTSAERSLQKISHTLIIYEEQIIQQEVMRKVTEVTIPSIYVEMSVPNRKTVVGTKYTCLNRGLIVSTPNDENSFKYIWKYMKIEAVQNEEVVKISNVSKRVTKEFSGLRGELTVLLETLNPGKTKIYAVSPTNQKILILNLTVDDIILDNSNLEIKENEEAEINVISGATKEAKWSSSDDNIVQIIESEYNKVKIKGINEGTATITWKNKQENQSRTCEITVKKELNEENKDDQNNDTKDDSKDDTKEDTKEDQKEEVKIPYKIQDKKYCTGIKKNISKAQIKKDLNSSEFKIKDHKNNEILDDTKIGTGMKLEVNNTEYVLVIQGDLNGDGDITTIDISKLREQIIEREMLQNEYKLAADINGDEKITLTDLSQLKGEIIK